MISHIQGQCITKNQDSLVIDVGGLGYRVYTTTIVTESVTTDDTVALWTHLVVRENVMDLYGFFELEELEFFELLLGVSGIGPKGAVQVMNLAPAKTLKHAIGSGDTSYLTKVSGIGKKTAEKIVLELKDKLEDYAHENTDNGRGEDTEVVAALVALGYTQQQSRDALQKVPADVEGINGRIKEALKILTA